VEVLECVAGQPAGISLEARDSFGNPTAWSVAELNALSVRLEDAPASAGDFEMVAANGNLLRLEGLFEEAASMLLHIAVGGKVLRRWPRTMQVVAGVADVHACNVVLPTDDDDRVVLQVWELFGTGHLISHHI
jgi:hypothetical protein